LEVKITVNMNREGGVEACEVKGILNHTANTDVGAAAVISVNKAQLPLSFNSATHPKVDKKGYEQQGILSLKGGKGFPVGRAVGILRWSYGNDDAVPISINCWPEDEGSGRFLVSVEMELTRKDLVCMMSTFFCLLEHQSLLPLRALTVSTSMIPLPA
jgi:coatomer subunit delta